jgi:hypothetical protein
LENVAFLVERSNPVRAAKLFTALAKRDGPTAVASEARAALAIARSGAFEHAKPALEEVLKKDWTKGPLKNERLALEAVETTLLEHATGEDFKSLWNLAEGRGAALNFPFPSVWPHQERLFDRCVVLNDLPRARALGKRIEEEREELSDDLLQKLRSVRLPQV